MEANQQQIEMLNGLATAHIGRKVKLKAAKGEGGTLFEIAGLDEKVSTISEALGANYVILRSVSNNAVRIVLHPRAANDLLKTGESSQMIVLSEDGSLPTPAAKPAEPAKASATRAPRAPRADGERSKKDIAVEIYTAMVAAGNTRKEIIEAYKTQLQMGDAGAGTYYQNIKSGKWK